MSLQLSGSFGLATYPEDGNTVPTDPAVRRHDDVRGEDDAQQYRGGRQRDC